MKHLLISVVILLCSSFTVVDETNIVKVGDTVPDFTVTMYDGSHVSISDLRGKVVLLNFWATWCPPCRQELSVVQKEIIDRFKDRDFVFLPISREDTKDKITEFREEFGHAFPMGMDPKREIYSLFATQTIPRNYLIDKNGKIVLFEKGFDKDVLKELIDTIEKLLN